MKITWRLKQITVDKPSTTVSELLKKLKTCAACGKANGEGGAEAALEAALCAAVFGTMKRTVSDKKKKEKSKA